MSSPEGCGAVAGAEEVVELSESGQPSLLPVSRQQQAQQHYHQQSTHQHPSFIELPENCKVNILRKATLGIYTGRAGFK